MFYSPPDRALGLWDTWLFRQGDDLHLFYLQRQLTEIGCSSVGHAVSQDWVHWETLAPALEQGTGFDWDAGPLMTGMVLAHAGRYYMFYGAMADRVQRIGLAVSDDLMNWDKVGGGPVLEPGGPWYETDPVQAMNYETAWRDPYVFYHAPEDRFYAFICARVPGSDDIGGGCIAVARSTDLLDWTLLPPAYVSDVLTCLEVPEYFTFDGRHYLSYTTSYHFGTPYPLRDPYQATGTFYLVSDAMLSGYREPEHDDVLNAGLPHVITNYVGRSIPQADDQSQRYYYYHHVYPPRPDESLYGSLSAPKLLEDRPDGGLVLRYNPLLDAHFDPPVIHDDPLNTDTLLVVLSREASDGKFEATVTVPYAGVCFRLGMGREGLLEGLAAWIAPVNRGTTELRVLLGTVHFSDGLYGVRPAFGNPVALRSLDPLNAHSFDDHIRLCVVCRGPFVDVYVDDVFYLTHTYAPETMPEHGGAGVFYAGVPKNGAVLRACVRRFNNSVMTSTADGFRWR